MPGATLRDTAGLVGGETSTAAASESHLSVQISAWTHRRRNPSLGIKGEARTGPGVVTSASNSAPVLLGPSEPFPTPYLYVSKERSLPEC